MPAAEKHAGNKVEAGDLWTATYVLMGLRYDLQTIEAAMKGVEGMKESATYQAIMDVGRLEGMRQGLAKRKLEVMLEGLHSSLLRIGRKRLGKVSAKTKAAIEAITDIDRFEEMVDGLLDVSTWQELLA